MPCLLHFLCLPICLNSAGAQGHHTTTNWARTHCCSMIMQQGTTRIHNCGMPSSFHIGNQRHAMAAAHTHTRTRPCIYTHLHAPHAQLPPRLPRDTTNPCYGLSPQIQPSSAEALPQPCSSSTAASAAALPQLDHSSAANPAAVQPQLCRSCAVPELCRSCAVPELCRSSATALPQLYRGFIDRPVAITGARTTYTTQAES